MWCIGRTYGVREDGGYLKLRIYKLFLEFGNTILESDFGVDQNDCLLSFLILLMFTSMMLTLLLTILKFTSMMSLLTGMKLQLS